VCQAPFWIKGKAWKGSDLSKVTQLATCRNGCNICALILHTTGPLIWM
jgi:hypothetical protein